MLITDLLDITDNSVVAVVGCGGKTTLAELIAEKLRDKKVMVSTTVKIFPMKTDGAMLCTTRRQCLKHEPKRGIQCLGVMNARSGKLEALPDSDLAVLVPLYDVSLLEADGSKGLSCKGWLDNEPVVPGYCTHTVGVVATGVIGKAAKEDVVHRLREFLSLTGLRAGDAITAQSLERMVCSPRGMFNKSAGRRYLVVNQVEDEAAVRSAKAFLHAIKEKNPGFFVRLIYGSAHHDIWREA